MLKNMSSGMRWIWVQIPDARALVSSKTLLRKWYKSACFMLVAIL